MDDLDFGQTLRGFAAGQKVFERYTLMRMLGRGGMGVVWLAQDEKLRREVALKFLPEVVAQDREAIEDLKRETRRALELTHPRIVRIYDFVDDSRLAAVSMEYVPGSSLAVLKLDQPQKCFSVAQLAPWVQQLCEALAYAHTEAQIVHR
nr:protein kinase [Opitutaceae bacterium]